MRVALLSCNARAGDAIGNQVAEKLALLVERGADVRVFLESLERLHPQVAAHAEVLHPESIGDAWDYLVGADLVCVEFGHYYTLLNLLPLLAGGKPRILIDYHGITPPQLWGQHNREALEKGRTYRGLTWYADLTVVHSRCVEQELIDTTGIPSEGIARLGLPVDPEQFFPADSSASLRSPGLENATILLYVGRLAPNKRVPLLIDALGRLSDIEPPVHVCIVGDTGDLYRAEAERCRQRARDLGVEDRLHFLGQLVGEPLRRAYQSADVFVMPSAWESFSLPVVEAMACGIPVVAARAFALSETIGDAGLTFTPDDAEDLSRQVRRVLAPTTYDCSAPAGRERKHRVAVVSFRFGANIVGGAETSLRTMAHALCDAGHYLEVFTTCTASESNWKNDLPPGTTTLAGLTVHRFPVDPHDHAAHGEIVRTILEADGGLPAELQEQYLGHSIHSSALLDALRHGDFDAIITGPYLFGLTADIIGEFPGKTLLVPCFHDEAIARLPLWPRLYSNAGGILYHSVEEQIYAQAVLGVNHPNTTVIGTCLAAVEKQAPAAAPSSCRPYAVYCGRYSGQKNVPLLLDWARRYQAQNPGQFDFVFMGRGEVQIPNETWLRDLGRVEEDVKHAVLAGAKALVQLSRYESLSLVALEAWREGTPVIAHRDCAVLVGQIERSQGGVAVADYQAFAAALDDLRADETTWRQRGDNGRAYVNATYLSPKNYVSNISRCLDQLQKPLRQQMRERGLERACVFSRAHWQQGFAELVEKALTQPARPYREVIHIEPLRSACRVGVDAGTLLLPVRLRNEGTHAAVAEGPGRTVLCYEICERVGGRVAIGNTDTPLPALLMPGQSQVAAVPIALPAEVGAYRIRLWAERLGTLRAEPGFAAEVRLVVEAEHASSSTSCASTFLETVEKTLPKAHHLQQLPADYVDVTEGQLAPVKRFVKRKLLHNFKHAYVDVLSRQQSQVNGHLVLMIQQLAECCAMLDHAVTGLHQRLDQLEARIERNRSTVPRCEQEEMDRTLDL